MLARTNPLLESLIKMAVDHIRYDLLTQDALRSVVRRVLLDAARNGLPGDHHFYITFATKAEGVQISPRVQAQYPEEMTVVLQHQFWDLTVTDERFQVGLSFSGVAERLSIPFTAIKAFFDPSVQFGLQFEEVTAAGDSAAAEDGTKAQTGSPEASPAARRLEAVPSDAAAAGGGPQDDDDPPARPDGTGGGEVVQLDRFRKK